MKIEWARLSEDREMELQEEWDPVARDLDGPGLEWDGPLKVRALVKRDGGIVVARIFAEGPARLTCARCNQEQQSSLSRSFRLIYPKEEVVEEPVMLDDNIREELMLTYPVKVLCRDDCRGLCPRCGADLNTERCRCQVA